MKFAMSSIALGLAFCLTAPALADTPTARASWVVSKVYGYNHPFAAALPDELATKMGKMAASPFAFYRGTAHLFYEDMKTWNASYYTTYATGTTWLAGDMHLANLGAFRDDAGNMVYDTTDFDEGYWGQYVWDVRRMAASIVLAAKEGGRSASDRETLVRAFLDNYLNKIGEFRGTSDELAYRLTTSNTSGEVKDLIQKAAGQTRGDFLAKTTTTASGTRKFLTNAELRVLPAATYSAMVTAVGNYVYTIASSKRYAASYYTVKDVRLKLGSGVGSLGRARYYVLIEGPTSSQSDDVILQVKQQSPSVVAIAAPGALPAYAYESHEGQRAARSMKASLSQTERLVGWTTLGGSPYLVREKSPYEADVDLAKLDSLAKWTAAVQYMGKVLAKSHAMADKDYDATLSPYSMDKEIDDAIYSKSGFKDEIVLFATRYAQQVELDWQAFVNARKAGTPLY